MQALKNFWSRERVLPALLAAAYSATCLGYAWSFHQFSCKTFSFLWGTHGYSEALAGSVERTMVVLFLLSAVCIWIRPVRGVALLGAGAMLVEMLSETFVPSAKYPMVYWAEWALRYSVPVAALLLFKSGKVCKERSVRIMRIAIALVFAAHGIKALLAEPQFLDFLLVTSRRLGWGMDEGQSLMLLHMIGTVDLIVAAHLLFLRPVCNRGVLLWMAVWGAITAFSRITYGGWGNWHEVMIRTSHLLVPVVLYLLYRWRPSSTASE